MSFLDALKRTRWSSFDPMLNQIYTSPDTARTRGNWGMKHDVPLPIISKPEGNVEFKLPPRRFKERFGGIAPGDPNREVNATNKRHQKHLVISGMDSKFKLPVYKSAEGEARAFRAWKESEAGLTIQDGSSKQELGYGLPDLYALSEPEFKRYLEQVKGIKDDFHHYLRQKYGHGLQDRALSALMHSEHISPAEHLLFLSQWMRDRIKGPDTEPLKIFRQKKEAEMERSRLGLLKGKGRAGFRHGDWSRRISKTEWQRFKGQMDEKMDILPINIDSEGLQYAPVTRMHQVTRAPAIPGRFLPEPELKILKMVKMASPSNTDESTHSVAMAVGVAGAQYKDLSGLTELDLNFRNEDKPYTPGDVGEFRVDRAIKKGDWMHVSLRQANVEATPDTSFSSRVQRNPHRPGSAEYIAWTPTLLAPKVIPLDRDIYAMPLPRAPYRGENPAGFMRNTKGPQSRRPGFTIPSEPRLSASEMLRGMIAKAKSDKVEPKSDVKEDEKEEKE